MPQRCGNTLGRGRILVRGVDVIERTPARKPRLVKATGWWRVSNPESDGCHSCGEEPSHRFSYFKTLAEAELVIQQGTLWSRAAYCGLHCWGQVNGWCEL